MAKQFTGDYKSPGMSIATNLRYLLIKIIAGKTVVILNADIHIIPRKNNSAMSAKGCQGLLVHGCNFNDGEYILHVEQAGQEQPHDSQSGGAK